MFINIIEQLPVRPRKQVLKSLIGSLNSSIIGYVRGHIRNSKYENASRDGQEQSIDKYNEAMAAQLEHVADAQALKDMGLNVTMEPLDVARHLEAIRGWAIESLVDMASHPNDVPLTISDTIKFQLNSEPNINEPALKALALALQMDLEALRAAKVKVLQDDRDELLDMSGQIIDLAEHLGVDSMEAEEAFSGLPVQIQYKLAATLANGIKKSGDSALAALLRYNRLESAGDITMIKDAHRQVYDWIKAFTQTNLVALTEYQDNGGKLAEVAPLS